MTSARAVRVAILFLAAVALGLAGCGDSVAPDPGPSVPPPPPPPPAVLTVTVDPSTDHQTGTVGTALSTRLRVMVRSDGIPKEGVAITWSAPEGNIFPATAITDADGFAGATFVLGTTSGSKRAYAVAFGSGGATATFTAVAVPGPAAVITAEFGDGQTLPANWPAFSALAVLVTDSYGNSVEHEPVSWVVEQGPVVVITEGGATDPSGYAWSLVAPSGVPGAAKVRAELNNGASVSFALTAGSPEWKVTVGVIGDFWMISEQNHSSPPVDTLPVGAAMQWAINPYDYEDHILESVGVSAFIGGDFPYGGVKSVTFVTPGTYQYTVDGIVNVVGTIVVQ